MELLFDVKNQIINRVDRNRVVSNSVDYLAVTVTFTNDWDGLDKQFCFKNGRTEIYIQLDGNDQITQENHLNLGVGTWKVFCIGTSQTQRILTNSTNLTVVASGYVGTDGPQPRTYDELLTIIQSLHTEAASEAVIRSAVEEFVGDNITDIINDYIGSDTGLQEIIQQAVNEYLGNEIDAATVNGHHVNKDVPASAKFTDTIYDDSNARIGYDGTVYNTLGEAIRGQILQMVDLIESGGGGGYYSDFTVDSGVVKGNETNTLSIAKYLYVDCTNVNHVSFDWSSTGSKHGIPNSTIKGTYVIDGNYVDLFQFSSGSGTSVDTSGSITVNVSALTGTQTFSFIATVANSGGASASLESQCLLNVTNIRIS